MSTDRLPPKTEKHVTNREIISALAVEAKCDKRTARRALEHGYATIRIIAIRDRISFALRRRPELATQYSKDHYP